MAKPLPNWADDVEDLKRFAGVRLIVADLDGTLIPSTLAEKIQVLIRSLHHPRYRVTLTLATGRTLAGVLPLLDKLRLPKGAPLILYNGSLILLNGSFKVIARRTISLDNLRRLLDICSAHCVRTFAYFYDESWFEPQSISQHEHVIAWASRCEPVREFNDMPVRWLTTHSLDQLVEPSSVLIDTTDDQLAAIAIEEQLNKIADISITRSGTRYIEVRPVGSNKGVALAGVATRFNFDRHEVLALGDNDNDSEMLAWAGIGVAIAEASTSAVQNSDYICRYGVFEGAVEVLNLVKHARRYFFRPHKAKTEVFKDEPHRPMAE